MNAVFPRLKFLYSSCWLSKSLMLLFLTYHQEFGCTEAPLFVVDSMLFSPSSKYLLLMGERGISVLEMPMRWGKFAEYDGGSESVLCRYFRTWFSQISGEVINVVKVEAIFSQVSSKTWAITLANHKSHGQCNEPIMTQSKYMFPVAKSWSRRSLQACYRFCKDISLSVLQSFFFYSADCIAVNTWNMYEMFIVL